MPAADFRLYLAYYRKQPFGQWRQDYNAARVAQAMAGGKLEALMPFWFDEQIDEDITAYFPDALSVGE